MNMKQIEQLVLLEQSGELSARQKRDLEACPEAQVKRDELAALSNAIVELNVEPSPWVTTKITARLQGERRSRMIPLKIWSPIIAMAACVMIVVNVMDFKTATNRSSVDAVFADADVWNMQFDEELVELESLILAISGDPLDLMER